MDLHSTEPLPSNITWSTQPRDWEVLRTTALNSAGGPGCTGSTTRGEWDVRDHLANNAWRGSVTYGLFASNESKSTSNNSFKRFTRDRNNLPFLYIEYNQPPYTPWDLGTFPAPQNPNGNGCGWVGATNYAGMSIGAWIGDPQNQANDAIFHVVDTASGEVTYSSGWIGAGNATHWAATHPTNLVDGRTYTWRVQGGDGEMSSPWATGCTFSLDTQARSAPVVTSAEYPPSGTLPGSTKHVGQGGTFGVRASDRISGVLSYEWAFNSAIPVGGANRVGRPFTAGGSWSVDGVVGASLTALPAPSLLQHPLVSDPVGWTGPSLASVATDCSPGFVGPMGQSVRRVLGPLVESSALCVGKDRGGSDQQHRCQGVPLSAALGIRQEPQSFAIRLRGDARAFGLKHPGFSPWQVPWMCRAGVRVAWEDVDRSHGDPLCYAPA
ncbi:hypothetical protein [Streptomyces sp. NRRL S-448]|uniref:hypothetical protein n=1 Tax=Streptomyces sp. NRRL S-448 TaxID=1463907 RepID=UPI003563B259